jgi:hypothetical protein
MHTRALPAARRRSRIVDYFGIAVPLLLLTMTAVVLRLHLPELAFVVIADLIGLVLAPLVCIKDFFK